MLQASPLSRPSGTHWQNIGISIPAINRWAIISRPSGTKYIGRGTMRHNRFAVPILLPSQYLCRTTRATPQESEANEIFGRRP